LISPHVGQIRFKLGMTQAHCFKINNNNNNNKDVYKLKIISEDLVYNSVRG